LQSKRDSAILAQEQSAHLFLCVLISDLTYRYGPVIRQAQVINVLDSAFDVLVSEFGIEKRVHVDQMPIDVSADDFRDKPLKPIPFRTTFSRSILIRYRFTGPIAMS